MVGMGFEVHLDAGVYRVPEGLVGEGIQVKVCAEVAVETMKNIEIEGGGGSGGIVIGGQKCGLTFIRTGAEVGAKQELVSG